MGLAGGGRGARGSRYLQDRRRVRPHPAAFHAAPFGHAVQGACQRQVPAEGHLQLDVCGRAAGEGRMERPERRREPVHRASEDEPLHVQDVRGGARQTCARHRHRRRTGSVCLRPQPLLRDGRQRAFSARCRSGQISGCAHEGAAFPVLHAETARRAQAHLLAAEQGRQRKGACPQAARASRVQGLRGGAR